MPHAIARVVPGVGHGWLARIPDLHARMVRAWIEDRRFPTSSARRLVLGGRLDRGAALWKRRTAIGGRSGLWRFARLAVFVDSADLEAIER
jgi:hypothetical protein